MIKYYTAFVFFCTISIQTFAQQPVVLTDATSLISIGKQIEVFEDPGETLSLQQILSPEYQSRFKKSNQQVPNYGTKQTAVWCKISIKNTSPKEWILNVDFPILHSVSLFQPLGNAYIKEEIGRSTPFTERKIRNRSFLFPLHIEAGEVKTIYLRVENHICIFPLYISTIGAISAKQHPEDTLYGIYYGICFIIAFYAIALFIASRERYYLYFFFQVIFFFLYGMIYCGDSSHWFPEFALPLTDYGTVIICTAQVFVCLFFDALLKTRKKITSASRLFLICKILLVIAILFYFAGYRPLTATISMLVPSAVFFYSIFLCFHLKHENIIRLIFIGFVIGFAILLIWILMLRNLMPYSGIINNMLIVQYTWFMIIFSLALELNINNYIKEKYKAQKELLINLEEKEKLITRQNEMLEQKVEERTHELKAMQNHLIQQEKLASLGELTAGIAHEIQNPLNFVNNFSEVNNELIEELKSQKSKLKNEEQDDILNNIFQNNDKISHHGKRADAIIKGMLQHSQKSSSQKEPTDINALAEEYLRLSYHGFRAKDNSFNVTIKTDYDTGIPKINIIPQDIGRVLLNVYNNAFYSVNEKKKMNNDGYDATVSVATKKS